MSVSEIQRATRWEKGVSGNPSGRPKGSSEFQASLPELVDAVVSDAIRIHKMGIKPSLKTLIRKHNRGCDVRRSVYMAIRNAVRESHVPIRPGGCPKIHGTETGRVFFNRKELPKEILDEIEADARRMNSKGIRPGAKTLTRKYFGTESSDEFRKSLRDYLISRGVRMHGTFAFQTEGEGQPIVEATIVPPVQQDPIPGVLGGMTAESLVEMKEKLDEDYQASIGEALDELNATARRQDELDLALSRLADEGNIRAHVLLMHRLGVR